MDTLQRMFQKRNVTSTPHIPIFHYWCLLYFSPVILSVDT